MSTGNCHRDSETGEPTKKRLRQTSILDSFSFQRKISKRAEESQNLVEEAILSDLANEKEEDMSDNRGEEMSQQMRERAAGAAERRRSAKSPWSTPPHDDESHDDQPANQSPSSHHHRHHKSHDSPSSHSSSSRHGRHKPSPSGVVRSKYVDEDKPGTSRDTTSTSHHGRRDHKHKRRSRSDSSPEHGGPNSPIVIPDSPTTIPESPVLSEPPMDSPASPSNQSDTLVYEDSEPVFSNPDVLSQRDPSQPSWFGTPISALNRTPACSSSLPSLKPDSHHTVLFRPHLRPGDPPRPFPDKYRDVWDDAHVRMPCSDENLYPVQDQDGSKTVKSRWEVVQSALLGNIQNSLDLEEAILTYNSRYANRWDFRGLHSFFTEYLDDDEARSFFKVTLPAMVKLALRLPEIVTQSPPLLKKQMRHSITLSQLQVASLLANAFFCTFPRRNAYQRNSEYSSFPSINFNDLFKGGKHGVDRRRAEKLKTLVHYFKRVTIRMPSGTLTFRRQSFPKMPVWKTCKDPLSRLHVSAEGTIEEDGTGMLQVDFANKVIGGGVLGLGLVQEEIRFLICPEMILSRLFTETLEPDECLVIIGAEQYSCYKGYSDTYKWAGDYQDQTTRDTWGRRCTEVVAIDALKYRTYTEQCNPGMVKRELDKAFCGFHRSDVLPIKLSAIATGNWGCGAFGGDSRIKGLIQMMAAAVAKRDLVYFTFGNAQLAEDLYKMHEFAEANSLTVGDLWNVIQSYNRTCAKTSRKPAVELFNYIYQMYSDFQDSTDEEGAGQNWEEGAEGKGHGSQIKGWGSDEEGADGRTERKESLDYKAMTP
ncbi:poly(ADP-ribose) glycohydrolase-like [Branchiostoma lanceolatum]